MEEILPLLWFRRVPKQPYTKYNIISSGNISERHLFAYKSVSEFLAIWQSMLQVLITSREAWVVL